MTETACTKIKHLNECSTLKSSIIQPFTSVPVVRAAVMLGKRLKIARYRLVTKTSASKTNPEVRNEVEGKREKMIGKKWLFLK